MCLVSYPSRNLSTDSFRDPLFFVARQIQLSNAGTIDLLLITDEGLPVVVEVKLRRNAGTRREIIAQIFDYVSDLTLMDFLQLDTLVDGALEEVIEDLSTESESKDLRKEFANHLRSGETRFILAVDEAPEDLLRILEFLCRHTNLDVRLVEVRKFEEAAGHVIHVPSIKVERHTDEIRSSVRQFPPAAVNREFEDFFEAMRKGFPELKPRWEDFRYATLTLGKGCQIRYDIPAKPQSLRVSFKSWRQPVDRVLAAVNKVFPDWNQPILGKYSLEIIRGKGDIISYATQILLAPEGAINAETVREEAARLFGFLVEKFSDVVKEL